MPKSLLRLIRRVKKYAALSWWEQRLFIEAFCLAGVVRLLILLVPFRWLARFLGKHMQESPAQEDAAKLATARRIGMIVEIVSCHTPWESKCLVQAIVGKILLRHRGINNTLYLGVGKNEGESLMAHAWLRCGKEIITGGQNMERFTVVGKFGDDGEFEEAEGRG